jgi:CRP/FNR family cyclic AMP-dependent transcriptional regulator
LAESWPKHGDGPKSPLPTIGSLVPSAGIISIWNMILVCLGGACQPSPLSERALAVRNSQRHNQHREGDVPMETNPVSSFDIMGFLTQLVPKRTTSKYQTDQILYSQGDSADSVFYIHKGKVKVTVISERGKQAIVAIQGPDEFCGEGTLTGMIPFRLSTAVAFTTSEIIRLDKETMMRLLRLEPEFADYFLFHLLTRTAKVEADLVDRLFSSSELRLARALLLLASFGEDFGPDPIAIKVNHGVLAEMAGTTRSRVNVFMNKFRKLGLINYNGKLEVKRGLLNFVLNQKAKV